MHKMKKMHWSFIMEKFDTSKKSGTKLFLFFLLLGVGFIVLFIYLSSKDIFKSPDSDSLESEEDTQEYLPYEGIKIVVDAGHGGEDPGKVGVNGTLEKNINLKIALRLSEELRKLGMTVIMTREKDISLGDGGKNRKMQDLKLRVGLIDENNPDLAISIHQNSYTDPAVYGPQVFYHSKSEEGGVAARCVQEALNSGLAIEKPRECKDNVSYYLLSNTKSPLIISECAFLSNEEDEAKLNNDEYIESVIQCLVEGICNYLECR